VPGLEVAGVIVSVDMNVPQQRLDKRMIALTNGGAYAQFVATVAELELPMPEPAGSICACLSLQQHICLVQLRDNLFDQTLLPWHRSPRQIGSTNFIFGSV
jgi:NADPH:quinone reductase-like Zn-dependent oxidoreductase